MKTARILTIVGLTAPLAVLLAGCGGGGGSAISNKTLVGALRDYQSTPIAGAGVVYDSGTANAQTTTTGPTGAYRFVLPLSAITGSDTLTFFDAAGHLLDVESVTLGRNTDAASITTVAPPVPPAV